MRGERVTDRRARRYITITDDAMWEYIDKIMTHPDYDKSFNKVINSALLFGLPILYKRLFDTVEIDGEETPVIFLFSIGPWIINTNDLLSIKISCSITMLVFSLLLFFSALWNGQFYTIDKGFIVCKNCFCVIQKISIEDAICIIQELPTYFNWMTSTSKKWICIYCKNSNFRFETGCSNSRKKKGIQIIYTDNNYELIDKLCQVDTI